MMKKHKELVGIVAIFILILGSSVLLFFSHEHRVNVKKAEAAEALALKKNEAAKKAKTELLKEQLKKEKEQAAAEKKANDKIARGNKAMRVPINWQESSQTTPYPKFQAGDWLKVSIADQRTYVMRGNDIIYTMYCSTGIDGDNATPTGNFAIEPERGDSFYSQRSNEGANFWVSFHNHGTYLFHSIPVDTSGNYIAAEGEKYGLEASSHGCVRLSVSDSKWLYQNVPEGLKVVVA